MKKLVVLAFVLAFGVLLAAGAGSVMANDKTGEQQAFVNWSPREISGYTVQLIKPGVIYVRVKVKPESVEETRQIMRDLAESYRKHTDYSSPVGIVVFAGNRIVMRGKF